MDNRSLTPPDRIASDLAPGEVRAVELDWSDLRIDRIRSTSHPLFRAAYDRLWSEFGPSGGMEREAVISERFGWDPTRPVDEHALLYEMLVVRRGEQVVAVRDHTAILPCADRTGGTVIVHLSHNLVEPALRGSGLAGWLRAFPIQLGRECSVAVDAPATHLTLVAEMERPRGSTRAESRALRSYGRAGFSKIDPDVISYCQPDFRAPDEIERTSVQPLPFVLVVRRVGREGARSISGGEARSIVTGLYTMFGAHIRTDHMNPLWARLDQFPAENEEIPLLSPSRA